MYFLPIRLQDRKKLIKHFKFNNSYREIFSFSSQNNISTDLSTMLNQYFLQQCSYSKSGFWNL